MTTPHQRRSDDAQGDPLGDVIRGSLQCHVSRSTPPADGWPLLRSQVRAGPARRRRIAGLRFQHLVNGIVQGAAAMIVIAMLGASLTPGSPTEVPQQSPLAPIQLVVDDVDALPLLVPADDMPPRVAILVSPPPAPVYLATSGDTLSTAELVKLRSPSIRFDPVLLLMSNPGLDPTMRYYTQ